jgi:hypothetical protein
VAAIYTLIHSAKINDVDPHAWFADVLARLQDHPAKRLDELLPWNWKRERTQKAAAAVIRSASTGDPPPPWPSPDFTGFTGLHRMRTRDETWLVARVR